MSLTGTGIIVISLDVFIFLKFFVAYYLEHENLTEARALRQQSAYSRHRPNAGNSYFLTILIHRLELFINFHLSDRRMYAQPKKKQN